MKFDKLSASIYGMFCLLIMMLYAVVKGFFPIEKTLLIVDCSLTGIIIFGLVAGAIRK